MTSPPTPDPAGNGAPCAACASLVAQNTALADKNSELEIALTSNRRIGMAMGILMNRLQLTEKQAFDLLRTASNTTNTKLAAIAEELVHTGTFQTAPAR